MKKTGPLLLRARLPEDCVKNLDWVAAGYGGNRSRAIRAAINNWQLAVLEAANENDEAFSKSEWAWLKLCFKELGAKKLEYFNDPSRQLASMVSIRTVEKWRLELSRKLESLSYVRAYAIVFVLFSNSKQE